MNEPLLSYLHAVREGLGRQDRMDGLGRWADKMNGVSNTKLGGLDGLSGMGGLDGPGGCGGTDENSNKLPYNAPWFQDNPGQHLNWATLC